MAVIKRCCCCCQLRTGVIVLGCIRTVISLFYLTAVSYIYANLHNIVWNIVEKSNTDDPEENQHIANTLERVLDRGLSIVITDAVVSVMACILLVWGASIGNRFMLIPWLVLEMISILCWGFLFLFGGFVGFFIKDVGAVLGFVVLVFGGLLIVAFYVYIWMCVLSCFQELRDSQTSQDNTLLEMPKRLEKVIVVDQPPEYERLESIRKLG